MFSSRRNSFWKIFANGNKKLFECSALSFEFITGFWLVSKDDGLFVLPALFE